MIWMKSKIKSLFQDLEDLVDESIVEKTERFEIIVSLFIVFKLAISIILYSMLYIERHLYLLNILERSIGVAHLESFKFVILTFYGTVYYVIRLVIKKEYIRYNELISEINVKSERMADNSIKLITINALKLKNIKYQANLILSFLLFTSLAKLFGDLFLIIGYTSSRTGFIAYVEWFDYGLSSVCIILIFYFIDSTNSEENELLTELTSKLTSLNCGHLYIEEKINALIKNLNYVNDEQAKILTITPVNFSFLITFINTTITFSVMVITLIKSR